MFLSFPPLSSSSASSSNPLPLSSAPSPLHRAQIGYEIGRTCHMDGRAGGGRDETWHPPQSKLSVVSAAFYDLSPSNSSRLSSRFPLVRSATNVSTGSGSHRPSQTLFYLTCMNKVAGFISLHSCNPFQILSRLAVWKLLNFPFQSSVPPRGSLEPQGGCVLRCEWSTCDNGRFGRRSE